MSLVKFFGFGLKIRLKFGLSLKKSLIVGFGLGLRKKFVLNLFLGLNVKIL